MYILEKTKPFYATLKHLSLTYHFPEREDKSYLCTFYIKFTIVQAICLVFYCGGNLTHLVMTLKDDLELDISEDMSVLMGNFGSLAICFMFTLTYRDWCDFFNKITDVSMFGKPADLDATIKRCNLFSTIFFWYTNIGIIIYGAASMAETSDCKQLNKDKGYHELCGTFVPIWLPIEESKLVVTTVFFAQFITAYLFIVPSALITFVPTEASMLLTSHINHFKSCFSGIFEEPTYQRRRNRLKFCVQYHVHIMSMANELNSLVRFSIGIIPPISAIVFGCLENQILNSKPMGAGIYLTAYIVAIFWLCHAGEIIKDETLSMSDILYDANWYKVEPSIQKDVSFVVLRAQRPLCLDALPFGALNYTLFIAILKTSYSYLTLLNQTT